MHSRKAILLTALVGAALLLTGCTAPKTTTVPSITATAKPTAQPTALPSGATVAPSATPSVDKSMATPEQTVKTYLADIKSGNRAFTANLFYTANAFNAPENQTLLGLKLDTYRILSASEKADSGDTIVRVEYTIKGDGLAQTRAFSLRQNTKIDRTEDVTLMPWFITNFSATTVS